MTQRSDVVIAGGGLAGSTLALRLKTLRPGLDVTVLERVRHPVPPHAHKVGESTVEMAAHYLAEKCGLRKHLDESHLPKFGLRFFFSGDDRIERRFEFGPSRHFDVPSYQVDRGVLENHLRERCLGAGVRYADGVTVRDVRPDTDGHRVVHSGGEDVCRWFVDASGRAGLLRRKFGLGEKAGHAGCSAWWRVRGVVDVDGWSDDPAFRTAVGGPANPRAKRRLSTVHMAGEGYWVWIIPLADDVTSIGIVTDGERHPFSSISSPGRAAAWLGRHEPGLASFSGRLETLDFKVMKDYPLGCRQVFSSERWAVVGEAGVFLDPFYSPGSDFIALGNDFVTSLVLADADGKDVRTAALVYDKVYLDVCKHTLKIYQDSFGIFGNPLVTSVKVVWDFAVYWAFTAFLYTQERFTDLAFLLGHTADFERVAGLNAEMQRLFREWHHDEPCRGGQGFLDMSDAPLLADLNATLLPVLDDERFEKELSRRSAALSGLADEVRAFREGERLPPDGFFADLSKTFRGPPRGATTPYRSGRERPPREAASP